MWKCISITAVDHSASKVRTPPIFLSQCPPINMHVFFYKGFKTKRMGYIRDDADEIVLGGEMLITCSPILLESTILFTPLYARSQPQILSHWIPSIKMLSIVGKTKHKSVRQHSKLPRSVYIVNTNKISCRADHNDSLDFQFGSCFSLKVSVFPRSTGW
jgi:hypothetical protein